MKYSVILADPPWHFKTFSEKGQGKSPSKHYNTMLQDELLELPVADFAADDCVLFMWATWPKIFDADLLMWKWGFKYSGLAWEWIKYNDKTEKFAFGTGYGTRKNLEPCLLARKGSPKLLSRSCRDILFSPAREHSRKPDVQYERIERMYQGPYLELFARQRWPGWDVAFSNQADKFPIEIEVV